MEKKEEPEPAEEDSSPAEAASYVPDDRKEITPDDKSILIVEDDPRFARILLDISRERDFKCLVAENGKTGLHLADYYRPSAIILDLGLPDMDGMQVIDQLKDNAVTRHIPVHVVSGHEKKLAALKMGAVGFVRKPANMDHLDQAFGKIEGVISRPVKELLVVEDDEATRRSIEELIAEDDVNITMVTSGEEALAKLQAAPYDCMVLDLKLSDMTGVDLLERVRRDSEFSDIPVVIFTGKELSPDERKTIDRYADRVITKGAKAAERLLDETSLFLHRVEQFMPEEKQRMIRMLHDKESIFQDRTVMIVDDDMRNVFALSNVLEDKGLKTVMAQNGREAIDLLNNNGVVQAVLMDIMMPEMDGYEAMRQIRKQQKFKDLPIIALTAKAMQGDRAKCIEAGANDYLSKPVDSDKLLSMLRVWLYQ